MATGINFTSDLPRIYDIVQNTMMRANKDIIIGSLKEFFSEDSYYHYVKDEWGFAKTPDHTDLPDGAGLNDDLTTRLYIGERDRYDVIYYPAVLVSSGSWSSVPIGLQRNKYVVQYKSINYIDGYGNNTIVQTPDYYLLAGAWEGSISIEVNARGLRARDDLVELISIHLMDLRWDEYFKSGVAIKPAEISIGAPSETEDYNEKLYKQTISVSIRSEWRREIPVTDVLEAINICVDIGNLSKDPPEFASNLTINTKVDLMDNLSEIE